MKDLKPLLLRVDNILITALEHKINWVVTSLKRKFATKDLGDVRHLLAMEVHQMKDHITLSQSA